MLTYSDEIVSRHTKHRLVAHLCAAARRLRSAGQEFRLDSHTRVLLGRSWTCTRRPFVSGTYSTLPVRTNIWLGPFRLAYTDKRFRIISFLQDFNSLSSCQPVNLTLDDALYARKKVEQKTWSFLVALCFVVIDVLLRLFKIQ